MVKEVCVSANWQSNKYSTYTYICTHLHICMYVNKQQITEYIHSTVIYIYAYICSTYLWNYHRALNRYGKQKIKSQNFINCIWVWLADCQTLGIWELWAQPSCVYITRCCRRNVNWPIDQACTCSMLKLYDARIFTYKHTCQTSKQTVGDYTISSTALYIWFMVAGSCNSTLNCL